VRAESAQLDQPLWHAVTAWLARDWRFTRVAYAARPWLRRPRGGVVDLDRGDRTARRTCRRLRGSTSGGAH